MNFFEVRQKGSHIVMQKKTNNTTITVPVPNHSEIKIGTLQSIIVNREFRENILKMIELILW
jgi:predicted RNA binding protein YcfA (HicA-like mRNA interferase family)